MKENLKSLTLFIFSGAVVVFLLTLPALLTTGIKPDMDVRGKGVISVTHLDNTVVGEQTDWKVYTSPGRSIIINGVEYTIETVETDETITLAVPYVGKTSTMESYSLVYPRDLPFIDEARDQLFSFSGIFILFLIGVAFGYFHPERSWRWALGTITPFYIFPIAEMFINPDSHNLFPFEFILYGIMSTFGIIGARVGESLRVKRDFPHLPYRFF